MVYRDLHSYTKTVWIFCMFMLRALAYCTILLRSSVSFQPIHQNQQRSIMSAAVSFCQNEEATSSTATKTLLLGKRSVLQGINVSKTTGLNVPDTTMKSMMDSVSSKGGTASTFVETSQFYCGILPESVSRHNHPLSTTMITDIIGKVKPQRINFCAEQLNGSLVDALTAAAAKGFPLYSRKTSDTKPTTPLEISFHDESGKVFTDYNAQHQTALWDGVQLAARLMDMTPEELTTTAFAKEARDLFDNDESVTVTEIVGSELDAKGYGGIYGVGKAATEAPRFVILEYKATNPTNTVALVGKGIVYDTGGLALKPKVGMCGMKHDMGGAAGLLGAFYNLVQRKVEKNVTLHLCLAENAIGPTAFRNDDILTLYSGKTVEINNSDAEGRLVLGDGVAHATKHMKDLDLVIDMATLTGAQLVATGKTHAGILATSPEMEDAAVAAGLNSGDLVYPLLYCPELLMKEFDSKVADMKNSVKDRGNAQTSCAGHFIESHLDELYEGEWLHIDMAGPGSKDERGTGYGVALVTALVEADIPKKK